MGGIQFVHVIQVHFGTLDLVISVQVKKMCIRDSNKSATPMDARADLLIQDGLGNVFSQMCIRDRFFILSIL